MPAYRGLRLSDAPDLRGPGSGPRSGRGPADGPAVTGESARRFWYRERRDDLPEEERERLAGLAERTIDAFRLQGIAVTRDYYLQRALKAVADRWPAGTPVCDPHDGRPILQWAFAGGTALTNAHRIADRYSEDMDLVLMPLEDEPISPRSLRRCRKLVQAHVIESVTSTLHAQAEMKGGRQVATALFAVGGADEFLKVDVADMPRIDDAIESKETWSLMGRVATEEEVEAFPELGGFRVPTVAVEVTAAGKLLTHYQMAGAAAHDRLRERARDLYDLACIANSEPHAARARERVPAVAEVLFNKGIQSWFTDAPRPARGLGSGLGFVPGTDAFIILRLAYLRVLEMVWGDWKPDYHQAVELARSLDHHPHPR